MDDAIVRSTEASLAGRIRSYYLSRVGSGDSFMLRYAPFCVASGLPFDGSGTLLATSVEFITQQVLEAEALVSLASIAKGEKRLDAAPAADGEAYETAQSYDPRTAAPTFVKLFTDFIETGLKAEVSYLPPFEKLAELRDKVK